MEEERTLMAGMIEGELCDDAGQDELWADERFSWHRGQYSDAVLSELESQNDQQVEGILGKVKILKEVCYHSLIIHLAMPCPMLYLGGGFHARLRLQPSV